MNTEINESALDDVTHATINALAAKGIQISPDLACDLNDVIGDFLSEKACVNTVEDTNTETSSKETLTFTVSLDYEREDGAPINKREMQSSLEFAIDNERANGALSDLDVSVTNFFITLNE